jgi:murein DD-endopeptidase MepM/ murein hydrolase activator NlpD
MHGANSVDLANTKGAPVVASAEGMVRIAKSDGYNYGYGKYIVIKHPNGTETLYAHNSEVLVVAGQVVTRGQQIAKIGSTGNSTGPHVHFEIKGAYNPYAW